MRSQRAEYASEIARPAEAVFDDCVDTDRWPEWGLRVVVARYEPPNLEIVNRIWFLATTTTTYTVTASERPSRFRLQPRGVLRLVGPAIVHLSNRQLRANHLALNDRLEADLLD